MLARQPRRQRRDKVAEHGHHHQEQKQSQPIVGRGQLGPHAQAGEKPQLLRQPAQQGKTGQADGKHHGDALNDVLVLEVAQLVGQHRVHLAGVQLLEQGVVKHHALGRAKAGEVGIGVGRAAAAVHHKQALGGKAAALHERRHTGAQGLVVQRLELVEQRRNHRGVEHQHQEVKAHPHGPGPQPPQRAGRAHQPHNECSNGQPNDRGQQQAFHQVGGPQARGDFVKAKALFQPKGGVEAERQVDQAANQGKGGQQCQLGPQRVLGRPTGALNQSVQGIEPTQQGPAQQNCRAQRQL